MDNEKQDPIAKYIADAKTVTEFLAAVQADEDSTASTSPETSTSTGLVHVPRGGSGPGDGTITPSRAVRSRSRAARRTKKRAHRKKASPAAATRLGSSSRASRRRAAPSASRMVVRDEGPPATKRLSRLELHQAHCGICGHELEEEIDERFTNWEHVNEIARDYELDRSAIYRHAHATGLFVKRDRNVRRALGRIIQEADGVMVTADCVIRAIKMLTHINARGEWVNPPTHVVFSTATNRSGSLSRPKSKGSSSAPPALELSGTPPHLNKRLKP
jgi:hypothetical protein